MNWNELLSSTRLGGVIILDEFTENAYPRSEFDKDYQRIISSASFRRLQDKTQVFPLDKSDFVRTRLTHSYETASIAKTLGTMVLSRTISKEAETEDQDLIRQIPNILSCVGLLHDIGNPPFGHFGEEIIQKWFESNLKNFTIEIEGTQTPISEILDQKYILDLTNFDGNAQAFRVLTKLHFQDSDFGFNLTDAVLNSLIKYPTASTGIKKKDQVGYSLLLKKLGYFTAEKDYYEDIISRTGAKNCRHPLAFILEAADDIAYKTADIEDGLKKGLFNLKHLHSFVDKRKDFYKNEENALYSDKVDVLFDKLFEFREIAYEKGLSKISNDAELYAMKNWIPYVQEWLMYVAAYRFDRNYTEIMEGSYHNDLFYQTFHHCSVEILKDIMEEFIFPNREIVKLELSANSILTNLLKHFVCATLYYDSEYKSREYIELRAYKKIFNLISENYRKSYERDRQKYADRLNREDGNNLSAKLRTCDIYLRLLLAVDYVSGMTDSYAKTIYQELNGII